LEPTRRSFEEGNTTRRALCPTRSVSRRERPTRRRKHDEKGPTRSFPSNIESIQGQRVREGFYGIKRQSTDSYVDYRYYYDYLDVIGPWKGPLWRLQRIFRHREAMFSIISIGVVPGEESKFLLIIKISILYTFNLSLCSAQ
jgi:hypothetical protein